MLGEDGLGYELAMALQSHGVWRAWLGDKDHSSLQPHLSSPSSWTSFMTSPSHLCLQLRVRALLFDKATVCLFLDSSTPVPPLSLDTSYLQLHADNVYFSLEQDIAEWSRLQAEGSEAISSLQIKFGADLLPNDLSSTEDSEESGFGNQESRQKRLMKASKQSSTLPNKSNQGPKLKRSNSSLYADRPEISLSSSKFTEAIPTCGDGGCGDIAENESWYQRWFQKSVLDRMHRLAWRAYQQKLPFKERESCQHTPQGMAAYLELLGKVNKRRCLFRSDSKQSSGQVNQIWENGSRDTLGQVAMDSPREDEDVNLLPEVMFPWNCVPDTPVPFKERFQVGQSCAGMDHWPKFSPSPLSAHFACHDNLDSLSNFKIYKVRQHETLFGALSKSDTGGPRKEISDEQADHLLQQFIVHTVSNAGFQGLKHAAMESLSRLFTCHIQKLGSTLRLLVDSYQNQCSQKELLKMFIRNCGCGDFGELLRGIKSHQQTMSKNNQVQLSVQPQAQQVHPDLKQSTQQFAQQMKFQNIQLQQPRRRQQAYSPRGSMGSNINIEKKSDRERTSPDIKTEMIAEPFSAADPKAVLQNVPLISQQPLSTWQQQLMQLTSSRHPYVVQQMKHPSSLSLPPVPQQSLVARDSLPTKIMKVEGLHELIGTDAIVKQESEDDKEGFIGSPSRRRWC